MKPPQAPPALPPPSAAEAAIVYAELLANLEIRRQAADDVRLRRMVHVPSPHPAP